MQRSMVSPQLVSRASCPFSWCPHGLEARDTLLAEMLPKKLIGALAADAVAALEVMGLKVIAGAEDFPGAAGFVDGALDVGDGKDVIPQPVLDEAGAGSDEGGEVA